MMTIIFILLKSVLLIARFTGIFSTIDNDTFWALFKSFTLTQKIEYLLLLSLANIIFANQFALIDILFTTVDIDLHIYLMREQFIDMNMYTLDIEKDFVVLRQMFDVKHRIMAILGYYGLFFIVLELFIHSA